MLDTEGPEPVQAADGSALPEVLSCPTCALPCCSGTPVCARCGALLLDASQTQRVNPLEDQVDASLKQPLGEAFLADTRPITLEVGERYVILPIAARLVIGRLGSSLNIDQPDVDLNQFSAREKGVSRRHCAITRKGKLVYLCDLGSSNGTRLNGRRLFGDQARLLRAGDELELGRLKLLVRF
jgi:hypothetical protein